MRRIKPAIKWDYWEFALCNILLQGQVVFFSIWYKVNLSRFRVFGSLSFCLILVRNWTKTWKCRSKLFCFAILLLCLILPTDQDRFVISAASVILANTKLVELYIFCLVLKGVSSVHRLCFKDGNWETCCSSRDFYWSTVVPWWHGNK